jgi:sugar lactone lactonase YvrE/formylglycine-generating enzyme required for sulfatase activity
MKTLSTILAAATLFVCSKPLHAYERLQGPTEVTYWNKTNAYTGYTFFGVRSNTYLINMEGRVVHTWPVGTNPHLLTNGNVLDATGGDVTSFSGLKEVDWSGSTVWQYTEARTDYAPHHDFLRIYNPNLGTNTTLYLAAKSISSNACVAAGCNPANGPYTNAQVDAIVEVDMSGNVVWEWCFFDHGIQNFDASKSNYVGSGRSISNYPGRLNLNLPGRPVTNDWLHCNSIDYNQALDQIVVNAVGGEFYVINHGNTFTAGNPAASIALAASTNGDFIYRFGDPARYSQGNPPSIQQNWATSTTGNKQIGGSSHAQWIASGLPGAGQFLVYNNGGDLFETTPQSYIFQINGYLNSTTNDTGAYVNPPTAGYYNWAAPGHDTDKRTKSMSRQITWMYYSMANQGMFSHLDSGVQRLPNGNTLICDSTEGHIFEVTAAGDAVWEYINPVSAEGIITYKRDNWPMHNGLFRAYRFPTSHPAFTGRTLTPQSTITGEAPSYISAPTISGTIITPAAPTAASSVWVTSLITNNRGVASATLTYIVGTSTNTVILLDDGLHQDSAASDGVYGGQIPAFPTGTIVSYYVSAQDDFGLTATDPVGVPGSRYSYVVQGGVTNTPPTLDAQLDRTVNPGYTLVVTNIAHDTDVPAQSLTFSFLNPPPNTSINTTSGVVSFSPSYGQFGTTNNITVVVTDSGSPAMSATNTFKAIVIANTAPVLAAIANHTLNAGDVLVITNFATDAEAPPQLLSYALAVAPTGATINATNGWLTWATSGTDAGSTNGFTVLVADNGVPSLLAARSFSVTVGSTSTPPSGAWTMAKLPDTGQTQSYTATVGEDSDYTVNPPSFTDNGDGTVKDNVTGLTWQKADGGEMTWASAGLYAQTNRVGGQSDWRLPTSHEAFSILNRGTVNPALNTTYFTLSAAQYWWSADPQVGDATRIWTINAGGGIGAHRQDETVSAGGTNRYHVRCVRGVALTGQPVHHFTNNLDGTITDLDTGLIWQQAEASAMNWESALQYAEELSFAGRTDWRLPNIKELQSINDETRANPSVDTNYFISANSSRHWSSTTVMNGTNRAWNVDFQFGLVSYEDKLSSLFVRCVRGGVTNSTPSTNSFTAQFAMMPAGQYQMGDHFGFVDPAHPSDEIPVHTVAVDSFYMETTLLTCLEYVQFLNSALAQGLVEVRSNYVYGVGGTNIYCDTYGSDTNSRVQWTGSAFTILNNRALHPITGIRWFGAIAYCNWASTRDGYAPCYNLTTGECGLTNSGYRLPTEAEWEYAARGGLYSPYGMFPWGSDTNADGTLANWAGKSHPFATGSTPWTTPVGFYNGSLQYQTNFNWPGSSATYQTRNNANGFGLYDMSGNVWEWINDWYAKDYYTNCVLNNIVTNPPGPVTGDPMPDGKPCRGLRGGNWFNGEDQYGHGRVANRDPSYFRGPGDPNGPWFHVGFRVMRRGYASVVATGATLTNLASGLHFTEGPAADAAGNVFFSDITADTIYKWSAANQLSVFRTNSGGANGICFDASGNLLACEGDNGRLVSITPQGTLTVVASNYAGLRFNEPNDLWIDPAGGVYFTDPVFFGHTAVQGGEYVYYLSPNRSSVIRVVTDMVRPNGLVGTPDGKTLYLADWGSGNVFRYSINTDGTLTNKTLFAQVKCDGMTLDAEGHLYLTENAIFVYDSTGNPLEQISVPERPTNLEFGGSDRKTLFITTDAGSLYSIRMRVQGATNAVVTTNQAPVITNTAISPSIPTTNDTVWVTARITDDVSVAGVSLTYSTGSGGGASQTNTAFLETMGLIPAKPWSGIGANNTWTVTGSSFEQRAGANYGAGNTNGLEFKGGTTNLTDSMIATTGSINALGSAGFVEFWIQTLTISNQYGNAGWTFQLDSGSGYVTRLSELTSSSHGWMLYHYNLQTSELVSSLKLRFQFRGGSVESRMDLDQISVKVITGGASSSTNVAMFDDGAHNDGTAGDGTYGTSIPAMPTGTAVTYYLTATDGADLSTVSPVGAPSTTYSYMVQAATSNSPPVIANTIASPSSPTATNSVWVTAQVTDNLSVATVRLSYNTGAGATNVAMLDDGLHQDGAAGDGTYGGQIPAFPVGTTVSYYLIATDGAGLSTTNPVGAPSATFSYTVRSTSTTQTVGLFLNTSNAWPGYTLMAPMHHTNTYMLNNAGEVVHVWTSTYEPGRSAYLMTNGHLFRAGMVKSGGPSTGGGEGGRIEEYDWDGNLVWAIDYYSSTYIHHHDFKVLPNGNVLMLVAEKKTLAEVIAAGFNTNLLDPSIFTQGYMLPDCLVEVTPTRPYGGTVVWEWHLWDHMIQDYDPTKNNYGVVANHPERIDVNGTGIKIPQFWNHVNGIDHNAQLDQVMLSIRGNSELFVIDHQTTTAQAAGTNGGRYSKGGDILYRWGNPAQYNRGTAANQQLFQQHHTHWIETNCPGAGNILIYNNGIGRGYSTINQIVPPVDAAGNYTISTGAAFGPTTPVWTYTATPPTNFYSAEISGAERLPNGNTLICEGIKGNLFEVTSAGQTVWRYVCPVTTTIMTQGDSIPVDPARTDQLMNAVFRVNRYATNYAGLLGRDLTAQGTIELPVDQTLRVVTSQATSSSYQFSWSSLPYRNYAVLYKVSLSATTWTSIATNRSIGTLTTFTDSNAARLSLPQGYYRVMQVP